MCKFCLFILSCQSYSDVFPFHSPFNLLRCEVGGPRKHRPRLVMTRHIFLSSAFAYVDSLMFCKFRIRPNVCVCVSGCMYHPADLSSGRNTWDSYPAGGPNRGQWAPANTRPWSHTQRSAALTQTHTHTHWFLSLSLSVTMIHIILKVLLPQFVFPLVFCD